MEKICVFCGSSSGTEPVYEAKAEETGRLLADRGISLVYGGGDAGLMGAVSRAHGEGEGKTIGIIPRALWDKVPHRESVELHVVEDMHRRKAMMYEMSDGFIALPGGIGTLEELFEAFTWNQLGYMDKPLGLLNSGGYFDDLISFLDGMVDRGFLKTIHRERLAVSDDPEELLALMEKSPGGYVGKWG
ncbi:MAG: TIGR00730 family Rossman fold protein [Spirochaetales bacterium]|nr:TIGR00730 family Rossman fold protein [Spirochaetales bacterium]